MGFDAEQSERIKRSQAFQELRAHPGYALFVGEIKRALGSTWDGFITSRPEDLPRLQAWTQGVLDVLKLVENAALDGERVIQEAEAQAERDRQEAEARQRFAEQRTERGIRLGARL